MKSHIIALVALLLFFSSFASSQNSKLQDAESIAERNRNLLSKATLDSNKPELSLSYLDSIDYEHQDLNDSIFRSIIQQSIDVIYGFAEDSIVFNYLNHYKSISVSRNDSASIAIIQDYITEYYLNQSRFEEALESANLTLSIYEKKKDYTNQGKVFLKIAAIQHSQGDYTASIETVFKAAEYFKNAGSSKHLAFSYMQIGTTYLFIQQYDLAIQNLNKAREQFLEEEDTLGAAMSTANIALVYLEQEEFKKALENFKSASVEILKSNRNLAIAQVYQNIAVSFFGLKQYDSTHYYLKKALIINNKINYALGISTVYLDYARLMKELNKLDSTIYYATQALKNIDKHTDIDIKHALYKLLGIALFESGDQLNASKYLFKHAMLEDSVNLENQHIERIAYQQDAKIKSYREQLLSEKQKQALYENENSYQKNLILILSFIGVLMVALIVVVSLINSKNSKLNKVLKENQKTIQNDLEIKNSLLKEIHHRVKNNLQVISSMLSIQGQYLEDEKFQEIINECKTRISSMALIHESLYRKDPNDITSIATYFNKLIPQLISTYQVDEGRIKLNIDIDDVELSIDESVPCGLLINEIVSNALKHAFPEDRKGKIDIRLTQNNQTYLLTIKDNGIGLKENVVPENQDTFGFLLIYTLVHQLDGQINMIRKDGLAYHISWKVNENLSVSDAYKA